MADHLQQHPAGAGNSKKDFPRIPKHAPSSFWQTMDWTNSKPQDPPSFPEVCGKRAALIRTLALEPELLLLDEPFSALDYQTRLSVSDDIGTIIRREGKTAVLVTHDISEAVSMADRVIVFSQRPAHIQKNHSHYFFHACAYPYGFPQCP